LLKRRHGESVQVFEQQADGSGAADGGAGAAQFVSEENRVQASGGGQDGAIQGPQPLRGGAVEGKGKIPEIAPVVGQVGAGDEDGAAVQQPAQGLGGGGALSGGEVADVKRHERGGGNESLQKGYLDLHGMVAGGRLGHGVEWRRGGPGNRRPPGGGGGPGRRFDGGDLGEGGGLYGGG